MVNEKQTGRVTAVEKEKTKLRERQRRAITSRILGGLRKHGGYNLPPRADINDVIKALATEAGWIVHPDGTTYRSKLGASESRIHGRHINPSMQPALLVADSTCMENGGGNADQCSSSVVEMGHGVGGFVHCWQLGHEYPIQLAIAERDQCNDGFVFGPRNPNMPHAIFNSATHLGEGPLLSPISHSFKNP